MPCSGSGCKFCLQRSVAKLTCCKGSKCCQTKTTERVARRKTPKRSCWKKCKEDCFNLGILLCWLIFGLTLMFGLILLFNGFCYKFPHVTPYEKDRIVFYTSVTYLFWTSLFALIFIVVSTYWKSKNRFCICLKNFWAFLHVVMGVAIIVFVFNMEPLKRYDSTTLQKMVGSTPNKQSWFIYVHQNEICCGVNNSTDIPDNFFKSHCDQIFQQSKTLVIGCGPVLQDYVTYCQFLVLIFIATATTSGLIPYVVCSKRKKAKKNKNAVAPAASQDPEVNKLNFQRVTT